MRAVYLDQLVGDAQYQGFTFGGSIRYEIGDSPATFRKGDYPGLRAVRVRMVGGGGGGGGVNIGTTGQAAAAGGGSGANYCEKWLTVDELGDDETVTVGAGGAGGANTPTSGSDGGTSSFGSLLEASGGLGGQAGVSTTNWSWAYEGSLVGNPGSPDLFVQGSPGVRGITNSYGTTGNGRCVQLGAGGDSMLGMGGADFSNSQTGSSGPDGRGYGAGGGGAYRNNATGSSVGGDGADGVVIVELWF